MSSNVKWIHYKFTGAGQKVMWSEGGIPVARQIRGHLPFSLFHSSPWFSSSQLWSVAHPEAASLWLLLPQPLFSFVSFCEASVSKRLIRLLAANQRSLSVSFPRHHEWKAFLFRRGRYHTDSWFHRVAACSKFTLWLIIRIPECDFDLVSLTAALYCDSVETLT